MSKKLSFENCSINVSELVSPRSAAAAECVSDVHNFRTRMHTHAHTHTHTYAHTRAQATCHPNKHTYHTLAHTTMLVTAM